MLSFWVCPLVNGKDSSHKGVEIIFLRHICYIGSQENMGIIYKECKMKIIMTRALDVAFERQKAVENEDRTK